MIYLDTSVILAWLFAEDRAPPAGFWSHTFVSSRLLEYEVFNRIHARRAAGSHGSHGTQARRLVDRVNLIQLAPQVLARASEPFPTPVRTLDALHLATLNFVFNQGEPIELATYDRRLAHAASAMGFVLSAATC